MKIAVVADDLTGANVNGALLTAKGFFSSTCLDLSEWCAEDFSRTAVVAVSVDSRLLPPDQARERVRKAVAVLSKQQPSLVAKRIDSTLRGNCGAEIEGALAAMDALSPDGSPEALAVVVPAYPGSGRIAVGGYLIVHGIALQRSPIAADPANPLTCSSVSSIIAAQTDLPLGSICLDVILEGSKAIRDAIDRLRGEKYKILVCDAVSDEDIRAIAEALRDSGFPILSVDPGPFTAELAAVLVPSSGVEFEDRVLALIGSTSQLTRRQIEALRLAHPTNLVKVDGKSFLDPTLREDAIARAVDEVRLGSASARVLGVCTAEKDEDVLSMESLSASLGLSTSQISESINSALGEIGRRLLAVPELRIGGLYTSGGEVTVAVIRALGGRGFSVRDEVLPLAAYGHLLEGSHPDLPMVTKGGFVGDTDSLAQCVEYLFTKISTRTRQAG